jgi:peptidoglycan/xylan/chitin deacetylase (PgdA/CDA1 family)
MYHRVAPGRSTDRYTVSADNFARQMQHLADSRCHVAPLQDLVAALDGEADLPDRSVFVTFDDGFRHTFEHATPVLTRLQFSATHFVVTGLTGTSSIWMKQDQGCPAPLMRWSDIADLRRAGFEVGSHTVTHPALPAVDPEQAKAEIEDSKKALEDRLGTPVSYFAYPFGLFDPRVRDMVEAAGYKAACSTLSGFANSTNDRFEIRRIEVFGSDTLRSFRRKLEFGANEMRLTDVMRYYLRRAVARRRD